MKNVLTNNQIKKIKSLQQKKFRVNTGLFTVEGPKMVNELIQSNFEIDHIYGTSGEGLKVEDHKISVISPKELKRISGLRQPNQVLAIAKIPRGPTKIAVPENNISLVLDNIQDPGNLGTIIRIAGWFGINAIFCSLDTADCYNPKVVQSTMGAIFKVEVAYTSIVDLIQQTDSTSNFGIYATHLNGVDIYHKKLKQNGLIIMGNESTGLNNMLLKDKVERLKIPPFPVVKQNIESLNVGVAAGIVCAEFRRRQLG